MKMIGVFDSLVFLIFYGAGGYAPARAEGIFLRLRPDVLTEVG